MFDQVWLVDFFHGRFSSLVNSEILLLHFHFLSSSRWCEKRALHQKISTFALPTKRSLTPLPAPIDVQCSGINTCAGCQAPIHFFFVRFYSNKPKTVCQEFFFCPGNIQIVNDEIWIDCVRLIVCYWLFWCCFCFKPPKSDQK